MVFQPGGHDETPFWSVEFDDGEFQLDATTEARGEIHRCKSEEELQGWMKRLSELPCRWLKDAVRPDCQRRLGMLRNERKHRNPDEQDDASN